MSWVVRGKKEAEAAGADTEMDEVIFAVTPGYVVEVYNRYRNQGLDEGDEGFVDRWEELPEKARRDLMDWTERALDKAFQNMDETINDALEGGERHVGLPG